MQFHQDVGTAKDHENSMSPSKLYEPTIVVSSQRSKSQLVVKSSPTVVSESTLSENDPTSEASLASCDMSDDRAIDIFSSSLPSSLSVSGPPIGASYRDQPRHLEQSSGPKSSKCSLSQHDSLAQLPKSINCSSAGDGSPVEVGRCIPSERLGGVVQVVPSVLYSAPSYSSSDCKPLSPHQQNVSHLSLSVDVHLPSPGGEIGRGAGAGVASFHDTAVAAQSPLNVSSDPVSSYQVSHTDGAGCRKPAASRPDGCSPAFLIASAPRTISPLGHAAAGQRKEIASSAVSVAQGGTLSPTRAKCHRSDASGHLGGCVEETDVVMSVEKQQQQPTPTPERRRRRRGRAEMSGGATAAAAADAACSSPSSRTTLVEEQVAAAAAAIPSSVVGGRKQRAAGCSVEGHGGAVVAGSVHIRERGQNNRVRKKSAGSDTTAAPATVDPARAVTLKRKREWGSWSAQEQRTFFCALEKQHRQQQQKQYKLQYKQQQQQQRQAQRGVGGVWCGGAGSSAGSSPPAAGAAGEGGGGGEWVGCAV